jgi:hypothetical protein
VINEKDWEELHYLAEMELENEADISLVTELIILRFDSSLATWDLIYAGSLCEYSKPYFYIANHLRGIGARAFQDSKLEEIHIPGNIKKIGTEAFSRSIYLERVAIDTGVREILSKAFQECLKLNTISLPNTITKINALAFDTRSNDLEIYYNDTLDRWNAIDKVSNWNGETHGRLFCSNCNVTF